MADLNTSLKPDQAFVPEQRAALPVMQDLATEYASWVGHKVAAKTPGYHGSNQVSGVLLAVLKGSGGDLVLKIECQNSWSRDEGDKRTNIPSLHLIPHSKIFEISRVKE